MRLQKVVAFSGLTVELFEDLDEGPDPPEPDATSFSQVLVCSAAPPAGPHPDASPDSLPRTDESYLSVDAAAAPGLGDGGMSAGPAGRGGEAAGAGPGPGSGSERTPAEHSRRAPAGAGSGSKVGLGVGCGTPEERGVPDGSSETDGWDEDMSPFELLPGMPGSHAANTPYPEPTPTPTAPAPGLPSSPPPAAASLAWPGQSTARSALTPSPSGAGSAEAGDGRHVVICSAQGVGCSGELRLRLTWHTPAQLHPSVRADLTLDPLQVRLQAPACHRFQPFLAYALLHSSHA